jgi:SAM-dependent methyltransferase
VETSSRPGAGSVKLGAMYARVYGRLCGEHPHLRPWHFQWLAAHELYADLRRVCAGLDGRVLDVGCGDKPYRGWLTGAREHVGIDVRGGPEVDHVIRTDEPWPLDSGSFDAVLCTQVLEHVVDVEHVLGEIDRVLGPGGRVVITVPFLYGEHGSPHDYRRFSLHCVRRLLPSSYELLELKPQNRAGSTLGTMWLHWLDGMLGAHRATRMLKGLLLPLWIPFCALVNLSCRLLDGLDRTGAFYANVLLVARKPPPSGS